ncbi:hypothetical protein PGTUg99_009646 [Puccinia graminis f. sp. tritici]|uniref:Uncharacterized protein n=1 Tax=Puccinia graminis f. sp. tritici TaxID=56615 RepID=A0A5B0S0M5_PUCGR|nr:hypothetical protein PGTUg99_009646 [Puccinia graminis f. sp. tritici]
MRDDRTPRATTEHHERRQNTTRNDRTPRATTEHHERRRNTTSNNYDDGGSSNWV